MKPGATGLRQSGKGSKLRYQSRLADLIDLLGGQALLIPDAQELLDLPDVEFNLLAHSFAKAAGGMVRQFRRAAGRMCWRQRMKLCDGDFGIWVDSYASMVGVSVRTLRELRNHTERAEGLPRPPASLAKARLDRKRGRSEDRAAIIAAPDASPPSSLAAADVALPIHPASIREVKTGNRQSLPHPATQPAPRQAEEVCLAEDECERVALQVRSLIAGVAATPPDQLAWSCTGEALAEARRRIDCALGLQRQGSLAPTTASPQPLPFRSVEGAWT